MRIITTVSLSLAAAAMALSLAACGGSDKAMHEGQMSSMPMSSAPMASGSSMPMASGSSMSMASMTGSFEGLNGKEVAGKVTVKGDMIMLTGFSSDEGPDLHLYLTNGTDEAAIAAGKQIDKVAFDQAEQSFTLTGVDTSGFTHVVVHCDKAKAVFGAAMLGS